MSADNEIQPINMEKIIGEKNPTLLRWMPKFILNYVKRTLHVEEMNQFIEIHHAKRNIDFIEAVLKHFEIKVKIIGIENLPREGGLVLVSNHPLGGLDALALMYELAQVRKDFHFLVNDILLNLRNIQDLFVPINKHGKNAKESLLKIDEQYASSEITLIFPAGLVSRKQSGEIKDLEWKKSFITKAKKYKRNVLPVHIEAYNSPFFYNLALYRKRLGVKANVEMFYLSDEMFKQRGKEIVIRIGEIIPVEKFENSKSDQDWAHWVKSVVYGLLPKK